jgi:hypothetical protein
MLAYHLTWHLQDVWAPLILATAHDTDPVNPVGVQFCSVLSVLSELATRTRCTISTQRTATTFDKLTTPTKMQAHALALAATETDIA